jgi:hypothetical protein
LIVAKDGDGVNVVDADNIGYSSSCGRLRQHQGHSSMQEFIPNTEVYSAPPGSPAPAEPNREPVLITVIGSAIGVDLVIKILHRLGFAEALTWSKPQIDPKTGKPMRVLTKWIRY